MSDLPMKLSVKSCNLVAVSVLVTQGDFSTTVPLLYDPGSGDVFFIGEEWDAPEEFSKVIRDYIKRQAGESPEVVDEQTWLQIRTLQALAKPPSKK